MSPDAQMREYFQQAEALMTRWVFDQLNGLWSQDREDQVLYDLGLIHSRADYLYGDNRSNTDLQQDYVRLMHIESAAERFVFWAENPESLPIIQSPASAGNDSLSIHYLMSVMHYGWARKLEGKDPGWSDERKQRETTFFQVMEPTVRTWLDQIKAKAAAMA